MQPCFESILLSLNRYEEVIQEWKPAIKQQQRHKSSKENLPLARGTTSIIAQKLTLTPDCWQQPVI
jgi:hypothetical protein